MKKQWKWLLWTALTYAGISLELTNHTEATGLHQSLLNLIASFQGLDFPRALMLPGLYVLYRRADGIRSSGKRWTMMLPACFFAVSMALGFAFSREGSWDMLWSLRNGQLFKTILYVLSWAWIAWNGLKVIYSFLDGIQFQGQEAAPGSVGGFHPLRFYACLLRKHTFAVPFLTLLMLYLPHILISYPAIFMGDTASIIVQAYGKLQNTGTEYLSLESLLRPDVFINQHHPAFYTVCLHGFLQLGETLFHSLNAGVFLFCLVQAGLILAAFAYVISALPRAKIPSGGLAALVLYAFLQPQVHNFLFLVTKDGCYAACFLFMTASLFRLQRRDANKGVVAALCLSAAGIILLRNEGKYVLILAGLLTALADRKNRKTALCFTAAAAVFAAVLFHGLYPLLGYTGGSLREALSIPFQQTTRVLRDHPEDVTEEERQVIGRVLDVERLPSLYDMNEADPVKATFREEATGAELGQYFQVWLGLLLRHPDTCLQATWGNYFQYFYPADARMSYYEYAWSDRMYAMTNELIAPLEKSFELPGWNGYGRLLHDSFIEAGLLYAPVFGGMMTPALYCWALLILLCWTARQAKEKRVRMRLICLMPALQLLVQFAGPTNGNYGRYMLPLTAVLPSLICMLLVLRQGRPEGSGL